MVVGCVTCKTRLCSSPSVLSRNDVNEPNLGRQKRAASQTGTEKAAKGENRGNLHRKDANDAAPAKSDAAAVEERHVQAEGLPPHLLQHLAVVA